MWCIGTLLAAVVAHSRCPPYNPAFASRLTGGAAILHQCPRALCGTAHCPNHKLSVESHMRCWLLTPRCLFHHHRTGVWVRGRRGYGPPQRGARGVPARAVRHRGRG